jgi:hypothetical protein
MTQEILNWISVIIGLIGIIFAIIFYIKSRKRKELCWIIISNNLIQESRNTIQSLSIRYKSKLISNLTVSKILFWNRGNETIYKCDLETINPLKIICKNNILTSEVIHKNNPSDNIRIITEKHKLSIIKFDYLNPRDGFILQVIHDGVSSNDITLQGDIIGVNVKQFGQLKIDNPIKVRLYTMTILLMILFVLFSVLFLYILSIIEGNPFYFFIALPISIILSLLFGWFINNQQDIVQYSSSKLAIKLIQLPFELFDKL